MSVRAYRIIKKEIAERSSFNTSHDDKLMDFFREADADEGMTYQETFSDIQSGTIEISVSLLEKALAEFKWEEDDYRREAFKKDIEHAKSKNEEYVLYECY